MSNTADLPANSLVLYKKRPARVITGGDRIEIELDDRNQVKVRPKDVVLLHPGPMTDLRQVVENVADADEEANLAWEILRESGTPCSLDALAELALGTFTPLTAWTAWRWVEDGLLFQGDPETIAARPESAVRRDRETRRARQEEAAARRDFINRAAAGQVSAGRDERFLKEIQDLALGRYAESRLMREMGHSERPETAHALLLEWGVWESTFNPHPARQGAVLDEPTAALPPLPDEPRLDLTGVPAYAIDDEGNQDPDDALSLIEYRRDENGRFAGGRIWVHVADAAALAEPDGPADLEARGRGVTLYLPERRIPMLSDLAVSELGLGLQPVSPALSFLITLDALARISAVEVHPTRICAKRLTYRQVEAQIETSPFKELAALAEAYENRRQAAGAIGMDLPEVSLRVCDGRVEIEPLERLRSRNLVREAMLMAGEAAAQLAQQNEIPIPYVVQQGASAEDQRPQVVIADPRPASAAPGSSLAMRFARRRSLRRSQISVHPAPHTGVGLEAYCRVTSPLRRYLDLVAHQQLRRWLRGEQPLDQAALFERLGGIEALTAAAARTESLSRRHWTLVYLQQHPGWRGVGVLVEASGSRGTILIPELALEAPIFLRSETALDTELLLSVRGINLPELEVSFTVL